MTWLRLGLLFALLLCTGVAHAEDGGNDVCPAVSADADDVRERYDANRQLIRQTRLQRGRDIQEVAIEYSGGHAVVRTERTPGHVRVARTTWDGDRVVVAECYEDGVRTGRADYRYQDDRIRSIEKRYFGANAANGNTTRFFYDAAGDLIASQVRGLDGRVINVVHAERVPPTVPVRLLLSAGGSYQSDTELYDLAAGLGIRRSPEPARYQDDPLDVRLEATFKFHRAEGVTTTDQTTGRFSADYRDILPRITLFTFTYSERNLPANLRLNLEQAILGVKLDLIPRGDYQLDVSFAPVWNFRSIRTPDSGVGTDPLADETTSKLRGSFRARAGVHRPTWSLLDTLEFLPTFYGDDVRPEDGLWDRSVLRNTVSLDVKLTTHLSFREEFKYTRDPAMRAQASCPDSDNPLCQGYSFASTTSLVLDVEL